MQCTAVILTLMTLSHAISVLPDPLFPASPFLPSIFFLKDLNEFNQGCLHEALHVGLFTELGQLAWDPITEEKVFRSPAAISCQ